MHKHLPQIGIRATYMRGGTSKEVFVTLDALPEIAKVAGLTRDALMLQVTVRTALQFRKASPSDAAQPLSAPPR